MKEESVIPMSLQISAADVVHFYLSDFHCTSSGVFPALDS